jgi:hypothetical protein
MNGTLRNASTIPVIESLNTAILNNTSQSVSLLESIIKSLYSTLEQTTDPETEIQVRITLANILLNYTEENYSDLGHILLRAVLLFIRMF